MPETLKKRRDFLAAARGRRIARAAFVLQALDRGDNGPARVGYTCSKKVGNAVARNRAQRRLREAARMIIPSNGRPGFDYVLIGRRNVTSEIGFADLCDELQSSLEKVHQES